MLSYREALHEPDSHRPSVQSGVVINVSSETGNDRYCNSDVTILWKQVEVRVRRLDVLNKRIESFLESLHLQFKETDHLSSKLNQNKYFPSIKRKLLMSRLVPYESTWGPLDQATTTPVKLVPTEELEAVFITEISALYTLESLSSEIVSKMIATISSDIPFCTEEVKAISHRLHQQFQPAWTILSKVVRTDPAIEQLPAPARWHYVSAISSKLHKAHAINHAEKNKDVSHRRQCLF